MPRSSLGLMAVLMLLCASSASATTRYVTPDGATSGPCDSTAPCSLATAIDGFTAVAQDGDDVVLAPGTYVVAKQLMVERSGLTLRGALDQARPQVASTAPNGPLFFDTHGTTLRHLAVLAGLPPGSNDGTTAIQFGLGSNLVEDLVVSVSARAGGANGILAFNSGSAAIAPTVVRDTLITGSAESGALTHLVDASATTVVLRNVTALGTGGNVYGLFARAYDGCYIGSAGSDSCPVDAHIDVENSIVRHSGPDATDIAGVQFPSPGGNASIAIDHSNFDPTSTLAAPSGATRVTFSFGTHNQSTVPLLTADGHQQPGSATIDAGSSTVSSLGTLDLDGEARAMGAAPDIGADEFTVTPPAHDPPLQPPAVGNGPPPADTQPPSLAQKLGAVSLAKKGTLVLTVTSTESGTIAASGTVTVPGAARTLKLTAAKQTCRAFQHVRLTLRLRKKARAAVRRALAHKRKVTAKLTLVATDIAGNRRVTTRSLRVRR